jgi:DNA-binding helix-hairpin-helix protein with protein kinase domain
LAAIFAATTIMVVAPQLWLLGLVAAFFGWAIAGAFGSGERKAERQRRSIDRDAARQAYEQVLEQAKKAAGPEGFQIIRADLGRARDEYQSLPKGEQHALAALHSTAQERQKKKFLASFFIDGASISGIGQGRKAALRSFGIETADDINRHDISQIRGFGETLTQVLIDWRAGCERQFVFNPSTAVSEADRNAVRARFGARRATLEGVLRAGSEELQRFCQMAASRLSLLQPQIIKAAQQFVQAQKDLAVL